MKVLNQWLDMRAWMDALDHVWWDASTPGEEAGFYSLWRNCLISEED